MRRGAKAGLILLGVMAGLALAALGVWAYTGQEGATPIEHWIGNSLLGVVQENLEPRLTWQALDYQAPLTVVIDEPRLLYEGVEILALRRLTLGLAEIPREGSPILIQRLELEAPRLRFIANESGGWVGWSSLVRAETPAPGRRFSDVLRMRELRISGGEIVVQQLGQPEMRLSGLSATLQTPPVADDPGAYRLDGELTRGSLFAARLAGQLDLDGGELTLDQLELRTALGPDAYGELPGALQTLLATYQIAGAFNARIRGEIPLNEPEDARLEAEVELQGAQAALHGAKIEIRALRAEVTLARRTLAARYSATLPAGSAAGEVRLNLANAERRLEVHNTELKLALAGSTGMLPAALQALIRDHGLTGEVSVRGQGVIPLDNPASARLDAELDVREGGFFWRARSAELEFLRAAVKLANQHLAADFSARFWDGSATGELDAQLHTGALFIKARLSNIDLQSAGALLLETNGAAPFRAISGSASGNVVLRGRIGELATASATGDAELRSARFQWGERELPIRRAALDFRLAEGTISGDYDADLLGGSATGDFARGAQGDTRLAWRARDVSLADLDRAVRRERAALTGRLDSEGRVSGRLEQLPESARGAGRLTVRDARLVSLPILTQLSDVVMGQIGQLLPLNTQRDSADAEFEILADRLKFTSFAVKCDTIAANGHGAIYFDQRLDLTVRAGVLQRAQSLLGPLQGLISPVTDHLGHYRVRGTLEQPQVEIRPLNLDLP